MSGDSSVYCFDNVCNDSICFGEVGVNMEFEMGDVVYMFIMFVFVFFLFFENVYVFFSFVGFLGSIYDF